MDSVEVAVRFTEAIMAKSNLSRTNKKADFAEKYVDMFAEVLKRVSVVMSPALVDPPPRSPRAATSEIFPLTHDR